MKKHQADTLADMRDKRAALKAAHKQVLSKLSDAFLLERFAKAFLAVQEYPEAAHDSIPLYLLEEECLRRMGFCG